MSIDPAGVASLPYMRRARRWRNADRSRVGVCGSVRSDGENSGQDYYRNHDQNTMTDTNDCVENGHEIDTNTIEVVSSNPAYGFEVEVDCAGCSARRHEYVEIGEMGVFKE